MEKSERKKWIFGEVRAFLILVILIGSLSFGVWYWYTHFYQENKNFVEKELTYDLVSLEAKEQFEEIGDYLIDKKDQCIVQVFNKSGTLIVDEKIEDANYYLGLDKSLYIYVDELGDAENQITLYHVKDDKFEEVYVLSKQNYYFVPIIYNDKNGNEYIVSFYGNSLSGNSNLLYSLDGTENELDFDMVGDKNRTVEEPIFTNNEKNIVVEKNNKYGIFSIENQKMVVSCNYEDLLNTYNDSYVAVKNGKFGIIDSNLKKLVSFNYDFIYVADNFFLIVKDGKLAVMDVKYNLITDFEFDWDLLESDRINEYHSEQNDFTSVNAFTIENAYVFQLGNEKKINFILEDGKHITLDADKLVYKEDEGILYSYDDEMKTYTFYNWNGKELEKLYTLNFTSYDFRNLVEFSRKGDNLLASVDGKVLFNDFSTGEDLDKFKKVEYKLNSFTFNLEDKKVFVKISGRKDISFSIEDEDIEDLKIKKDDNKFEFICKGRYLMYEAR